MYLLVPLAIVIELGYAIFTRTWLRAHASGIELELLLTAARLATAGIYWFMFRDLIRQRQITAAAAQASRPRSRPRPALLLAGLLPLLMVPLLFDGGLGPDVRFRAVFALTSIAVALHEEILYRGALQTLLEQRYGAWPALLLSNLAFVAFHYGAQPYTLFMLVEIFAMGCVLGLIYRQTGKLWPPILLHAAYDAAWSLGPWTTAPPDNLWRMPLHLSGLAIIVLWTGSSRSGARSASG
jgi:membrane protease YdiL (CAAX protease family)